RIVSSGDTKFKKGSYVQGVEFQDAYKDFTQTQIPPQCESPITYIPGKKTYEEPTKILDDDTQLIKFFGEFVWNYFRQTLKENSRAEHRKAPQKICGPGDWILVQEILSLCVRLKTDFNYCPKTQPENRMYNIAVLGLQTPPDFSSELMVLCQKAADNGIKIDCDHTAIRIHETFDIPYLEAFITKSEHVLVLDGYSSESDDDDGKAFTIAQVSYRTVGVERMQQEDHTVKIDAQDVINAVRCSLPDGECKQVFDIWAGRGQTYVDFSDQFGDGKACINHIARHLQITTRAVNMHKQIIKDNMLFYGMVPN
ncbi:MAG: hypothetical protein ACTSPB_26195, partial [Candidatus Thorarchaeota archaeon]